MWWSRPLLVVAVLALATGCGFRPLYDRADRSGVTAEMARIAVGVIEDRIGQQLRNHLMERLNPRGQPHRPIYRLTVTLQESTAYKALREDQTATRANVRINVSYTLRRAGTVEVETSGEVFAISSYNVVSSDFATEMADRNARGEATRMLAEDIVNELAIHFRARRDAARP